jgi:hypothetical protein
VELAPADAYSKEYMAVLQPLEWVAEQV